MCTAKYMTCLYKTLCYHCQYFINADSKYICIQIHGHIDSMAAESASRSLHLFSYHDIVASSCACSQACSKIVAASSAAFTCSRKLEQTLPDGIACDLHAAHICFTPSWVLGTANASNSHRHKALAWQSTWVRDQATLSSVQYRLRYSVAQLTLVQM